MKIEEKSLTIGNLIDPKYLDKFREELSELLVKMYNQGYERGYQDAQKIALDLMLKK